MKTKQLYPDGKELKNIASKCFSYWDELVGYPQQEEMLKNLFGNCPTNKDSDKVMIKVATLDSCYSTHLPSVYKMSERILGINDFDKMLQAGNLDLIDEMCKMEGYKPFSFSSKYCSHHCHKIYPIYDSLVAGLLIYYQATDNFMENGERLSYNKLKKSYATSFYPTIKKFRQYYDLEQYDFKQLDRVLWTLCKMENNIYDKFEITIGTNTRINRMIIRIENKGSVYVYELCPDFNVALDELSTSYGISDAEKGMISLGITRNWAEDDESGAIIEDYYIEADENGTVNIYKKKSNTKEGLREISKDINFEYNEKWNTRQFGRNLVNHIKEHPECLPK
ncbi:MAG: hypothetical protein LUC91_00430 [Prevotella sp.]|nr:hypothetical protein [Prevotella sp.]